MRPLPGRLVLLGSPVAHSISPVFQNAALAILGVPLTYESLDVAPSALPDRVRELREARGSGNVTIPHKAAMAALCDRTMSLARRTGAVNTFWVEHDGALVGDNTDVAGFLHLLHHAGCDQVPGRVALLGAGGAAAAVLAALEERHVPDVVLWGRSPDRRNALASRFPHVVRCTAPHAEDAASGASLVINATPVGLDDDALPVSTDVLEPGATIIDLICRRGSTAFVRAARRRGLRAEDGLAMLVEQGALALERWLGCSAPREVMWQAARGALGE